MDIGSFVVGKQPYLAITLIFRWGAGREVVRPPVDDLLARFSFPSDPHVHMAVLEFTAYTWPCPDMNLEGHPFVGKVGEAVPLRREIGWRLKAQYDALLAEPLPPRLAALVEKLESLPADSK